MTLFSSNSLAIRLPPALLAEAGVPARKYISEKFMMLPTCARLAPPPPRVTPLLLGPPTGLPIVTALCRFMMKVQDSR